MNQDAHHIAKIRAGDMNAYAALVDKYQSMVFVLVRSICHNAQEAQEVTQDIFLRAYNQLHTFRGAASFKTWLYRIAYNTAISHVRKEQSKDRHAQNYRSHTLHTTTSVQEEQDDNEEECHKKLMILIDSLPPNERLLIELYYYKDLKIEEIAHICSLTPSNAKVSLFRIRQKLKAAMEREKEEVERGETTKNTKEKL